VTILCFGKQPQQLLIDSRRPIENPDKSLPLGGGNNELRFVARILPGCHPLSWLCAAHGINPTPSFILWRVLLGFAE
jgi:hypothetical protein